MKQFYCKTIRNNLLMKLGLDIFYKDNSYFVMNKITLYRLQSIDFKSCRLLCGSKMLLNLMEKILKRKVLLNMKYEVHYPIAHECLF